MRCGDLEGGFDALEQSIKDQVLGCVWLKNTPELAAMQNHPRMKKLLQMLDGGKPLATNTKN
ncbi:MAG: hypothetical protein FJW36_02740 [Acidobacteria bacterium]|nr:hypothetical protein [Acidobacteriota bacterium]